MARPGEDFPADPALHAHVLPHPGPVDHDVKAVLDQTGKSLVALAAVVRLFTALQVQLAVVRLERRLALEVDVALGAMVLVLSFVLVLLSHVTLIRLAVLEGNATVLALVLHLGLFADLLLGSDLFVLLTAVQHQVWSLSQFYSVDFLQQLQGPKVIVFKDFKQTQHNQGLDQLFLAESWNLRVSTSVGN